MLHLSTLGYFRTKSSFVTGDYASFQVFESQLSRVIMGEIYQGLGGVAHLDVHGTSGSTSYETIPPVPLESSGGVLSTMDMVVQRRDGPRWLREHDDDDDDVDDDGAKPP